MRNILLPPPIILAGFIMCLFIQQSRPEADDALPAAGMSRPDGGARQPAATALDISAEPLAEEQYLSISENTLFLRQRQPWSADPEPPAAPEPRMEPETTGDPPEEDIAPLPPKLVLKGIVTSSGRSRALVLDERTGTESWIEPGDLYETWEVAEIGQNQVVLRAKGEVMVVTYNR